jgi:cell division initiation protein
MKIGPVDIRNHSFVKRSMRGLDETEVRAYLELVADGLQEAILEGEELRTKIDRLAHEVEEYRRLEQSLRDSLLSASKITDDRLAQAEKESQILIKDAEVEGEKILLRSREEAMRLHAAIDDLRRQRTTYVERFRALLRSQMKILEASIVGFDPESPEAEEYREIPVAPPPRSVAPPPSAPAPNWAPPSSQVAPAAPAPHMPHVPAPTWTPPASQVPPPMPPTDPPLGSYLGESGLFTPTGREGDPVRDA